MRAAVSRLRKGAKSAVLTVLPLAVRKPIAVWLGRQAWIRGRHWWSPELVRDLKEADPDAFHRFLWTNHLGYAETYEMPQRFGVANVHPSRRMLFADLAEFLRQRGTDIRTDIKSVFEVGCSMGYLLRYLEQEVAVSASVLEGIDIDEYAVYTGARHLEEAGSKVRLSVADMDDLERVLGHRSFDMILCAGVLMYLAEESAAPVVRAMLRHTNHCLVLAGLAHPEIDNSQLGQSTRRTQDGAFVHNLDAMVERAGGEVLYRRWAGPRMVDENTIYFLFCARGATDG